MAKSSIDVTSCTGKKFSTNMIAGKKYYKPVHYVCMDIIYPAYNPYPRP